MLSPDFLLRHALYASVAIGFVCPLVGVYLVLRRLVFLGIALPQISAAGIAFAYLLHTVGVHLYPHQEEEQPMALTGSILFVVAALIVLATLERRGRGMVEGHDKEDRAGQRHGLFLFLVRVEMHTHGMQEIREGDPGRRNLRQGDSQEHQPAKDQIDSDQGTDKADRHAGIQRMPKEEVRAEHLQQKSHVSRLPTSASLQSSLCSASAQPAR